MSKSSIEVFGHLHNVIHWLVEDVSDQGCPSFYVAQFEFQSLKVNFSMQFERCVVGSLLFRQGIC